MIVWLSDLVNSKVFKSPFFIFCYCGVIGVLVDVDHPIGQALGIYERFWHIPLCIIAIGVIIYCITHIRRLLNRSVLK